MINGKHGQGTHSTKMGADKLDENTPNAPKFICPICLPKDKSSGFQWKMASLGVHSPWNVCCSAQTAYKLVKTSYAKQTTGAKSLLS